MIRFVLTLAMIVGTLAYSVWAATHPLPKAVVKKPGEVVSNSLETPVAQPESLANGLRTCILSKGPVR